MVVRMVRTIGPEMAASASMNVVARARRTTRGPFFFSVVRLEDCEEGRFAMGQSPDPWKFMVMMVILPSHYRQEDRSHQSLSVGGP